ncbi:J domain-containing protein [Endozoicomonas sp. SESOKO1]|uniref:J domain-containing protein n=1 Tax=Endozoicomonas sp. SESOKO1 TaxID=2828742 RepID=UPI0021497CDB|nr:J domain-containing protein [Endozoicomonas sp. SESOKO1]
MNVFVKVNTVANHQLPQADVRVSTGRYCEKEVRQHHSGSLLNRAPDGNASRVYDRCRSVNEVDEFPELQKLFNYFRLQIDSLSKKLQGRERADGWRQFTNPVRAQITRMISLEVKLEQLLKEILTADSPVSRRKCQGISALLTQAVNNSNDWVTYCQDDARKRYFESLDCSTQLRITNLSWQLSDTIVPGKKLANTPDIHIIRTRSRLLFNLGLVRRKILTSRAAQRKAFDAEASCLAGQLGSIRKKCALTLKRAYRMMNESTSHASGDPGTSYSRRVPGRSVRMQETLDELLKLGRAPREYCLEILGIDEKTARDPVKIKQAYRRLCRKWHPDKNPDKQALEAFKKITQAYEILK